MNDCILKSVVKNVWLKKADIGTWLSLALQKSRASKSVIMNKVGDDLEELGEKLTFGANRIGN